ncbi:hypothetical protein [Clostridium butyricum]
MLIDKGFEIRIEYIEIILLITKIIWKGVAYMSQEKINFEHALKTFFPSGTIIKQMKVLDYSVDFYFEEISAIIEYDKDTHKKCDDERIDKILNELVRKANNYEPFFDGDHNDFYGNYSKNSFEVIRVEKGKEVEALKQIMDLLADMGLLQVCMDNYS